MQKLIGGIQAHQKSILKTVLFSLAVLLFLGLGALMLWLQPLSSAYSLQLNPQKLTLHVGEEEQLSCYFKKVSDNPLMLRLQEGKRAQLSYESTAPSVISVDQEGHVRALGQGQAEIIVRASDIESRIRVESCSRVQAFAFSADQDTLKPGEELALGVRTLPEDALLSEALCYSVSDENVLSVDEEGHLKALSTGTAAVRVSADGVSLEKEFRVVRPMTGIAFQYQDSEEPLTISCGNETQLSVAFCPEDTTDPREVRYTLSDPLLGSIDADGIFTAEIPGELTVHAACGAFTDELRIRIPAETAAERIILFGMQYLGTPYVYGGSSLTEGIDCSAFVRQCFASENIRLPRTSANQAACGNVLPLDPASWLPGDLLFYTQNGSVIHVAICLGGGRILHSAESMGGVCITDYDYNGNKPSIARRIL